MMKRLIINLVLSAIILLSPHYLVGGEESRTEIVVEGIAAARQAAPVAALREIGERVNGIKFSLYDGKYVQLGESVSALPLDTQDKKTVEIRELKSGLFKAQLQLEQSSSFLELVKNLRELTIRGESELTAGRSALGARSLAKKDALEKAILVAVAESFPGKSSPPVLTGRVLFLGTVEEKIEEGRYLLVARIKVSLVKP